MRKNVPACEATAITELVIVEAMRLWLDDISVGERIESSGLEGNEFEITVSQVYKEQQSQPKRETGQSWAPVLR